VNEANTYISEVYLWVKNTHNKQGNYGEDLIQYVFCIICEEDKDFIVSLAKQGKLRSYVCKILFNTRRWQRTEYHKQLAANEIPTEVFKEVADQSYSEIEIPLNKLYWYKARVLELYAELGNYRAVSEKTTIPLCSIFNTVQQARKEIKKHL